MGKHGTCDIFTATFNSREEAEEVLDDLEDIRSKYGFATLADLMDSLGCLQYDYRYNEIESPRLDSLKVKKVVRYELEVLYNFKEK